MSLFQFHSGSKSSPNSSSPNSSSITGPLCPAVFGLAGASPRGAEYDASINKEVGIKDLASKITNWNEDEAKMVFTFKEF